MKLTESNSVNLDKPLAESAAAPGECGSVPDVRRTAINNLCINGHLNQALNDVLKSNSPDGIFCILGALATNAIDEYIAALGMQPPNTAGKPNEQNAVVDALDFEPDAQRSIADMANVGYSLMQAIKLHCPTYSWNDSPAEIVGDLLEKVGSQEGK